ncbi:hypothetical protein HOO68_03290 [Candidatus Gracilibacteria bacterium]|nr:hypothetical protein [Candidatus Gracilibacteria bacterium]
MADTEIFRAGMNPPEDIDGFSAPPKGFKHFLDASGKDPVQWAKTVVMANFPAVTNMQVFHEAKSDMGGNMKVRFLYNGKPIELPVSYQQTMDTLTPTEYQNLAPHIQRMSPLERGLFNITLQHVRVLEKKHNAIKKSTHAALENEIQSA